MNIFEMIVTLALMAFFEMIVTLALMASQDVCRIAVRGPLPPVRITLAHTDQIINLDSHEALLCATDASTNIYFDAGNNIINQGSAIRISTERNRSARGR